MVPLGEVAELIRGITFAKSEQLENATPDSLLVATTKAAQECGIVEKDLYHIPRSLLKDENKLLRAGDILISTANSLNLLGRTTHIRRVERPMCFGAFMSVIRSKGRILDSYLLRVLRTKFALDFFVRNANTTTNISNLNLNTLAKFQIPLPPLEVQKEIVAEIEGYQKVIDGARAVLDNYRPHIPIHPDWPMVELGETALFRIESGGTPKSEAAECWGGTIAWATLVDLPASDYVSEIRSTQRTITERGLAESSAKLLPPDSVLVSTRATIGRIGINRIPLATNQGFKNIVIEDGSRAIAEYVALALTNAVPTMKAWATGGTFKELSKSKFCELRIPLPPIETQRAIVAEIEAEQALVNANRELIARMEKKIQATLARVWGEDEPAPAEA